jgi:phospholipid/cholesterol/gamma-HCH transport system substrate-binding protein
MQKQAPSIARIAIAVGFALSCFGLLLFIWVSFGGPTPFKAKQYEFTADFPEAVTLAKQSDVRIGGVSVGKVTALSLPEKGNATEVTVQMNPKYAPIPSDTRAILRQKTLLGETYIELTGGSPQAPKLADGGHLARAQTQDSAQLDEILQAFDPKTRQAFRIWIQNSSQAVNGRGQDLNDAFGNLGPFTSDATDILTILHHQQRSLQGLVRDTGTVFSALSARDNELAGAIQNSNTTFGALASRDRALASVIHIFPTFNEQTRLTLNRLAEFAHNTEPLVRDLKPVARDLTPTLIKVRRLSPHLRGLFIHLRPLLRVSQTGLPALSKTLRELRPVLAALDPFLANLNPVIRYTNAYKTNVGDFLMGPPAALGGTLDPSFEQAPGNPPPHLLRQISYLNSESLSVYPNRADTNRGNGYIQPLALTGFDAATHGIFPNWDCKNTNGGAGGDVGQPPESNATGPAPCFVAPSFPPEFGGKHGPQVFADP